MTDPALLFATATDFVHPGRDILEAVAHGGRVAHCGACKAPPVILNGDTQPGSGFASDSFVSFSGDSMMLLLAFGRFGQGQVLLHLLPSVSGRTEIPLIKETFRFFALACVFGGFGMPHFRHKLSASEGLPTDQKLFASLL